MTPDVSNSPVSVYTDIAARLSGVRQRIARTARLAGREPGSVRLVAVSKTFPLEYIRAAVAQGQREFGENRVQEALQKQAGTADVDIRWHLIGHLQANKARKATEAFACIHSIDSVELLRRIDAAAAELGRAPELLVQVDFADPPRFGVPPSGLRTLVDAADSCRAARVVGLMVLPPYTADPEAARPYFRRLRELRDQLAADGVPPAMLGELSMGMSHDVDVAIQEGASIVRLGTAIFGRREPRV